MTEAQPDRFKFDSIAGIYDRWYDTAEGKAYDIAEQKAVARVLPPPRPGGKLLDVGCGTGHWSAFFTALGYSVTGIDCAPSMVEVARDKNIRNAAFDVADAHEIPFEDGSFDVVAAITVLEFVRDAEAVVGEMARCARKPGGILLAAVLNADAPINRRRKSSSRPPYDAARFFTPDKLEAALAPYGETCIVSAGFVPSWKLLTPLAALTEWMGKSLFPAAGAFIAGRVRL